MENYYFYCTAFSTCLPDPKPWAEKEWGKCRGRRGSKMSKRHSPKLKNRRGYHPKKSKNAH